MALLTLKNVLEHTSLFLTAVPDKVILIILKLLFAEPVLLRLPILIVVLSYAILIVHLSPPVVPLVSNLLSSLFNL